MSSFEGKFLTFLTELRKTTPVSDQLSESLKKALQSVKWDQVGSGLVVQRRKKRLNGYNLFMKDRMGQLKETVSDSNQRMSKISEEWKTLPDEEKTLWKSKALEFVDAPTKLQVKMKSKPKDKPQHWSGYQLYVSENMSTLVDIKPKERMSAIGKLWKGLTPDQQQDFKTRATTKNSVSDCDASVAVTVNSSVVSTV